MTNDADVTRSMDQMGFIDAKGVSWRVALSDLPYRQGRVALDFASATGKRRSAQIKADQVEELRRMNDVAWRSMLANAAVIELE